MRPPDRSADGRALPPEPTLLVRVRAHIGDALFALPALDALRELYPHARVLFAAHRAVTPLFARDPRVDRFIPLDPPLRSTVRHAQVLASYLRLLLAERPVAHVALDAGGFLLPHLVWLAGVTHRLACMGQDVTGQRWHRAPPWMLTEHIPTPDEQGLHRAHGFLQLVERLGCDPTPRRMLLHREPGDAERGQETLRKAGVRDEPVVALHPGANWHDRKWPLDRMGLLARELHHAGVTPVVLGGPEDEAEVAALIEQGGAAHVRTKDLATLAHVLGAVDTLVANDSGPLHLACALGTPVVGLYGPNLPGVVGPDPLHPHARVMYNAPDCSPCVQNTLDRRARCARPHGDWCMERVGLGEVFETVMGLLRECAGKRTV